MYVEATSFTLQMIIRTANAWNEKKIDPDAAMKAIMLALRSLEDTQKAS